MWLFTGRHAVLARIVAWIHAETTGAFVVTGSAGSGKSAVVGRIVALSAPAQRPVVLEHAPLEPGDPDPGMGAVDAGVHLRGLGAQDLATVLADRLQLPAPGSCWQFIEAVAELPYPPVLVFDGLDEAIPEQATKIVTDLLVPLSVVASVLLATRHQEFGWHPPLSAQQAAVRLGELFRANTSVVNLDAEPDTRHDIERYLTRQLRSAGRADLVPRVAPALARKAATRQGGFLYARTVVSQIVRGVIDARAQGWEGQLPATTAGALEHDLSSGTLVRDGVELPDAATDLLRALAWGMGRGLPRQEVWEAAATALSPNGVTYRAADLDWVLEHYGCYILAEEQDGEAVYRLSHRTFVEHLVASSPNVAGRAAGQALAEALVALAQKQTTQNQTRHGDVTDLCSPYLRRHLPRHAVHAGPAGVAALRRLAEADPERYLPGLAATLCDFATHLLAVSSREAALISTQHAVDTYRALVDANPDTYLPGLAAVLGSLAAQHGDLGQHDVALIPAQEATDICRRLTEMSAEIHLTNLVMALKNLTYHLAALDRISVAVDVYTSYIEAFAASPSLRDTLIIERAGFHINHGDASTGLRELVTLLTLDDGQTPDAVMLSARHVLRAHRLRDSAAVNQVWQEVTGTEQPDWLALTLSQIGLVTRWITAPSWAKSRDIFSAHAGELLDRSAALVLDELALVAAAQVELHRHLLTGVRALGLEAAYRPLLLKDLLTDWIKLQDWQESLSFAEKHATDLLTVEAEIALHHLGNPIGTLVHVALLRLARREGFKAAYACVTDRQMAADRMRRALTEVEPDPIAELATLEGQVFGERFAAAAHLAVAASLLGEVVIDHTRLEELAEQAAPADRQRVATEIADLISRVPDRAESLCALPEILLSLDVRSGGRETAPENRAGDGG
jgi:L-amino acid N-acyltransferase YncA